MKENRQIIIVGSGIAGMTTAIYLKRAGLNPLVIEENVPGGQLNKINVIENYPSYINIDGPTLASKIYEQVRNLNIEYLFDKVVSVDFNSKTVKTNQKEIEYEYLIIATGRMSKKLLETDERYIGSGISYCAICDGYLYKNKEVGVVGGANSALEEAMYLSNICKKVYLINKNNHFKGEQVLIDEVLNKDNIEIMYNTNILKYNIEDNKLASITINDNNELNVEGLFISIGSTPSSEIFELNKEKGFLITNDRYETNEKNVFAIGDVIKKDVYQLTTAASEGTIVANYIIRELKKKNSDIK